MSRLVMISINDRGNLGARQLVALAKREGHEAFLVNFGEYRHDTYEFTENADSAKSREALAWIVPHLMPDVIGISYRSAMDWLAEIVAGDIRKACKAPIVAGGIGATSNPKGATEWANEIWTGEGEDFIWNLPSSSHFPMVKEHWGNLHDDLDSLPFPDYTPDTTWSIIRGQVIHPDGRLDNDIGAYPLLTSRGCPRACSYCHNSTVHELYRGQKYCRQRSVGHVMQEIEWALARWDLKLLSIYDDLFIADPDWALRFAAELPKVWPKDRVRMVNTLGAGPMPRQVAEPRPPRFWCMAHPSYIREDVIGALIASGMEEICLGVQSGSDRILKVYGRGTSREDILRACRVLSEFPVAVKIDIISANPLEMPEDIVATMDLLQKMPKRANWHPGLSRLTVFPGSAIGEQITQAQCDALHNDRQDFIDGLYNAAFVPRWRSTDLVDAIGRYDDFCAFRASRTWPEDKGPRSEEKWAPFSAWLDEGAQGKEGTASKQSSVISNQ